MKKNKGFTLIELIATVVILGLVTTIGSYAISTTIKNSKEKNYELLIANIESAAEMFYQDCKYVTGSIGSCQFKQDGSLEVSLETLISNGFLTSNKTKNQTGKLYNPKTDEEIKDCIIRIQKEQNRIKVEQVSTDAKCPVYTN